MQARDLVIKRHGAPGLIPILIISIPRVLRKFEWIAILAVRLFLGFLFAASAWGHIHHFAYYANSFKGWHIPFPVFAASMSIWTQFIGGILLMLGLLTWPTAIALAFDMWVAIVKVKAPQLKTYMDFFDLHEPLYMFCFLWLFFRGPGLISCDYWITRALGLPTPRWREDDRPAGRASVVSEP
ncbi:MAG: DoxX family protein [Candidatus Binataceae bacterium]